MSIVGSSTARGESLSSIDPDDLGFLELSSDLVCICRGDRITAINRAGARILETNDRSELVGRLFHDFLAPDYQEAVDESLIALVDEAQPFPMKLIGLNGSEIGAEVSVYIAGEAAPDAVIIFARDVTRQIEMSEAIHRSEQRYRSLVNHSMDLICVCDPAGVAFINQAGLRLLHHQDASEIVGRPLTALLHPDYREIFTDDIGTLLQEDAMLPVKLMRSDGKVLDAEVCLTPLDGRLHTHFMFEARDITEHLRHVTALRDLIETLEQRVENRTRDLRAEITERRKAEDKLRHMASHDVLTGLPNRYLLKDRLSTALARAHRDGTQAALLFIDLDGFKPINDTLGHDAGDMLLKGVAERLHANIRESDTAARLGGDEFVVLLSGVDGRDGAAHVANSLIGVLGDPFPLGSCADESDEARIGASIGIALYPNDGGDADTVMRMADEAMYRAKKGGKNTYRFAG